ncbi:MAG: SOS response-associated peptidase family protein [Ignavibacteriota bacterium]|nr:SOS response-associated peptidase family protein [Ignavibacteriota bacterium]
MCSRFENKETGESMFSKFEKDFLMLNIAAKDLKQINIAPNDDILVIHKNDNEFALKNFSWGIKFPGEKTPLIFNSRIETITSKPYWKNLFKRNRCIIPATAFYEWVAMDKIKIPKRISFESLPIFFFAGLYVKIDDGIFASIITTTSNSTIAKIHSRMPVIFNREEGIEYLKSDEESAIAMCLPFDDSVTMRIETAEDILTVKQKEFLKGK